MKLVIFTPAIKTSAIGRMTRLVVLQLLANQHEVVVVRTESQHVSVDESHDFNCSVLPWTGDEQVAHAIDDADCCIYQIGNSYEFHEGAIAWLGKVPGIVCLHDFFLGHLFFGWSQSRRSEAQQILSQWYGNTVAEEYFQIHDGATFINKTRTEAPLTEWISSMATCVITHSNWGCDRVMAACPGPVFVTPLAYDAPGATGAEVPSHGKLNILTIGHVNPNKRVESCILAIADSPALRANVRYRLVGAILPETEKRLTELANDNGVELIISNEVDDATLSEAIREADVISCLRWPSLEAASASAIEAMLYGKATIVTDTGFYSELPDQYVLKISVDNEVEELKKIFQLLHDDPSSATKIGKQAQSWAEGTFTAENYALKLEHAVPAARRAQVILSAVDNFSAIFEKWSANPELLGTPDILQPLNLFNTNTIV